MPKSVSRIGAGRFSHAPIVLDHETKLRAERAYKHRLSDRLWAQIVFTTGGYSYLSRVDDLMPLKKLKKALDDLNRRATVLRNGLTDEALSTEASLAKIADRYFCSIRKGQFSETEYLSILEWTISALIEVTRFGIKNLGTDAASYTLAIAQSDWWQIWIHDISLLLSEADLPITARNDQQNTSDFVRLIFEIQKSLPKNLQRNMPKHIYETTDVIGLSGLAQAIHQARKNVTSRELILDSLVKKIVRGPRIK